MKLCPECSFVYEDHQRVCDMDGNLLVHDPAAALAESQASAPTRLTINLPMESESSPAKSSAKRWPLLLILLVVLVSLLSVLAIAQVRRSRFSQAEQTPAPARSAAPDTKPPAPAPATELASVAVTAVTESSPDGPPEDALAIPADPSSLKNTRLSSNPVAAAAASVSNPRLVIVRLANGAVINADEVWETKEGYWYRQSGMVTFLKRSRVSSIEHLPSSRAPQKLATSSEERSNRSDNRKAQNQLRIARLEPVEKKPSRVKSFLKLTGRLLKKPFK